MVTGEEFLRDLREALNHLYDPDYLRHSPLATIFGVDGRFDTPAAVQRVLTEAIESLKPHGATQSQAPTWRVYDLLFYRYVQQAGQQEVADQLGVSVRQLRREQHAALETLAYELWDAFDLSEKTPGTAKPEERASATGDPTEEIIEELGWLKQKAPDTVTSLDEVITSVVNLATRLSEQHKVQLTTDTPEEIPNLAAHPIAVRQMLLNLVSVAISRATDGEISLRARHAHFDVELDVQGEPNTSDGTVKPLSDSEDRNLQVAEQLAKMSGGQLTLKSPTPGFSAVLRLPAAQQVPVLILDDNVDTLQLLQRYTSGTRYQAIVTQRPDTLISLAAVHRPAAIVLDVMMPEVDGWEMIGRLLQHPDTSDVPLVVCSILAQAELARSLGVAAYLQKPVSRQTFLDALDQHAHPQRREPARGSR